MLPYLPNPHHFSISQEQQPNPTAAAAAAVFPIMPPPPPPPPLHLDQHHHHHQHYDHFFSGGHGHFNNTETLEAVLLRPPRAPDPAVPAAAAVVPAPTRNGGGGTGGRGRKRPFRTDRHSKIRTAQGVRDRRMRLSLDVARDFFALQDRLGFDKASKTVDWLLTQSKPAIDRLAADNSSSSHHRNDADADAAAGDTRMSSPTSGDHHIGAGAGSGKERGGNSDKMRARGGRSVPAELGCELGRVVPAPVLREYCYYDLAEMMSNNGGGGGGGEGDDNGDYDDDGDFLDGMQY